MKHYKVRLNDNYKLLFEKKEQTSPIMKKKQRMEDSAELRMDASTQTDLCLTRLGL